MSFESSASHDSRPFLDAAVKLHCQATLNCSSRPLLLLLLFEQNNSYKCSLAFSSQNKPELLKLFQYSVFASWLIWTEVEQRVITRRLIGRFAGTVILGDAVQLVLS